MRNRFHVVPQLLCAATAWLLFVGAAARVQAADLKLEAQLIWGTNDPQSPDPNHKPAEPEIQKKLRSSPFKWAHYYEVNRREFSVPKDNSTKIAMSKDCEIQVRNLDGSNVEVSLIGKGHPAGKVRQPLPKGELLIYGGDAPNFTSWFVVLKRVE